MRSAPAALQRCMWPAAGRRCSWRRYCWRLASMEACATSGAAQPCTTPRRQPIGASSASCMPTQAAGPRRQILRVRKPNLPPYQAVHKEGGQTALHQSRCQVLLALYTILEGHVMPYGMSVLESTGSSSHQMPKDDIGAQHVCLCRC